MRPEREDIAAPELPPKTRWLGDEPAAMSELTARGPVLVHFFDFAQLNSVRALPYRTLWDARYREHGLTTLGVHSPRYPFTAPAETLRSAIADLGIEHPVADDSSYALWHDYGCEGWPSLFLWGQGGALRWFHFGEGEYEATELAIQEELAASLGVSELPEPLEPMRASDASGVVVVAPTPEVLPGGSASEAWVDGGEGLEVEYAAGGVYAAIDGSGTVSVSVDGLAAREVAVSGPALVELVAHASHEAHALRLRASAGVRVWAISFAAGVP
jgi:hypothetical protein